MQVDRFFSSPLEFIQKLEDTPSPRGLLSNMGHSNSSNRGFCDTYSFGEARDKGRFGDPKVARTIAPKDVLLQQHGAMNTTIYDYAGCSVDVGRYLSSEPECMMSLKKRGKPIINILVNVAANCFIERTAIEARGKAILEIMSGLETNGYGVDITIVNYVHGGGFMGGGNRDLRYRLEIKVKDSKEYFNIESLAFWLVSSSVLRRLYFKQAEQESPQIQDDIGNGYGGALNLEQEKLDAMPDCVYFPMIEDNNSSKYEQSIKQILETYKI